MGSAQGMGQKVSFMHLGAQTLRGSDVLLVTSGTNLQPGVLQRKVRADRKRFSESGREISKEKKGRTGWPASQFCLP